MIRVGLIILFFIIWSSKFVFGRGVYNIYWQSYTYDCWWKDDTSDWCKSWEIVLGMYQWWAPKSGSYRCWKKDYKAPFISDFKNTIKPHDQWVNILDYNPLKDFKVTISDWQAWVKKIVITVGNKVATWYFYTPVSVKTITYNDLCKKLIGTTNKCRQKILKEGKNIIKVEAWDAAKDPYDGRWYKGYRNHSTKYTYVYVDNSRSSYGIYGDIWYELKSISSKIDPSQIFANEKWRNKTLKINFKVKDLLWENWWLTPKTLVCSWKPLNSIWYLPEWVNPESWVFTTYCNGSNCTPNTSDCKWKCKDWYIKDKNWKCVLEKKEFSCKTYFQKKWYNVSKVDGVTLYYWLKWYWTNAINKKTGKFVAVYDINTNSYKPSLQDCLLIPWTVSYTITTNKGGKEKKITSTANGVIKIVGSLIKVISSIIEESCGKLSQLTDFIWAGDTVNWWGWDKVVPLYWISKTWYEIKKDDDNDHFVDDEDEWDWFYLDPNTNTYTKDITKACWKIQCVPNSSWLDSSNCQCNKWYYPIEINNKNRYNKCVKLSTNQCVLDSDGDGFYDTVKTLATNQIVKMVYEKYNVSKKVPVCGKVCGKLEIAKDTNWDWWPDTCKTKCCTFDQTNLDECVLCE